MSKEASIIMVVAFVFLLVAVVIYWVAERKTKATTGESSGKSKSLVEVIWNGIGTPPTVSQATEGNGVVRVIRTDSPDDSAAKAAEIALSRAKADLCELEEKIASAQETAKAKATAFEGVKVTPEEVMEAAKAAKVAAEAAAKAEEEAKAKSEAAKKAAEEAKAKSEALTKAAEASRSAEMEAKNAERVVEILERELEKAKATVRSAEEEVEKNTSATPPVVLSIKAEATTTDPEED